MRKISICVSVICLAFILSACSKGSNEENKAIKIPVMDSTKVEEKPRYISPTAFSVPFVHFHRVKDFIRRKGKFISGIKNLDLPEVYKYTFKDSEGTVHNFCIQKEDSEGMASLQGTIWKITVFAYPKGQAADGFIYEIDNRSAKASLKFNMLNAQQRENYGKYYNLMYFGFYEFLKKKVS